MNKERIPKLIIKPDEIEMNWNLKQEEQMFTCQSCGSMIFYVKKILGVIAEETDYQIYGWRGKRNYRIIEIGIDIFCSECGEHNEWYHTFRYDKDQVVCEYDDIGGEETGEIEFCLRQFNEKGKFTPLFKTGEARLLKEKLLEYEKKHPIKINKKNETRK